MQACVSYQIRHTDCFSASGAQTELDEETIKLTIAELCERKLLKITDTRRLEATERGAQAWQDFRRTEVIWFGR